MPKPPRAPQQTRSWVKSRCRAGTGRFSARGRGTVPTRRPHTFQVSITQPLTPIAPKIAGVRLWTSTDDGTYTVRARDPRYTATTGAVSLKVEAWDTGGSRIEQTTGRAFLLRDIDRTGPTT